MILWRPAQVIFRSSTVDLPTNTTKWIAKHSIPIAYNINSVASAGGLFLTMGLGILNHYLHYLHYLFTRMA